MKTEISQCIATATAASLLHVRRTVEDGAEQATTEQRIADLEAKIELSVQQSRIRHQAWASPALTALRPLNPICPTRCVHLRCPGNCFPAQPRKGKAEIGYFEFVLCRSGTAA